jgi:hypothetical protein
VVGFSQKVPDVRADGESSEQNPPQPTTAAKPTTLRRVGSLTFSSETAGPITGTCDAAAAPPVDMPLHKTQFGMARKLTVDG